MGIIGFAHSAFNSPVLPDGSWQMSMDSRETNKIMPPIHVAVPNIASTLGTLAMVLGVHHAVLDLANARFSISLATESQDQFAFTWEGQQWAFPKATSQPSNMSWDGNMRPDPVLPHNSKWTRYINDKMLTRRDSPLLQDTLKILLEHLQGKRSIHKKFKAQIPP